MVFLGRRRRSWRGKAGPNYPAPVAAIEAMEKGAGKTRDEALAIEAAAFAKVAKTPDRPRARQRLPRRPGGEEDREEGTRRRRAR